MKPRAHPHKEHPHTGMAGSQWRGFCWTQKDIVDGNKRLGQSTLEWVAISSPMHEREK